MAAIEPEKKDLKRILGVAAFTTHVFYVDLFGGKPATHAESSGETSSGTNASARPNMRENTNANTALNTFKSDKPSRAKAIILFLILVGIAGVYINMRYLNSDEGMPNAAEQKPLKALTPEQIKDMAEYEKMEAQTEAEALKEQEAH